jgi:hypothetical protein
MTMHPAESTFEAYVLGILPASERSSFVTHVAECEACSERLSREATLELSLLEARAALPPRRVTARRRRVPNVVYLAVAMAAAVLLWFRFRPHPPAPVAARAPAAPIPAVECRDWTKQAACIQEAHRHGLYVSYPATDSVPMLGGGASSAGPSAPPFRVARGGAR